MNNLCKKLILLLKQKNETISFMESCTGGFFCNEITNIDGSSEVFKVGLVTYSNEYKIKFGTDKNIIKKHTVYSIEVAREMAKNVSTFAKSSIGIGITGQIGNENINIAFISINRKDKFFDYELKVIGNNKFEKKKYIVKFVIEELLNNILNEKTI